MLFNTSLVQRKKYNHQLYKSEYSEENCEKCQQ